MSQDKLPLRLQLINLFRHDRELRAAKLPVHERIKDNRKPPWITVEYDILDADEGNANLSVVLWSARDNATTPDLNIDRFLPRLIELITVYSDGYIIGGGAGGAVVSAKGAAYRIYEINVADSRQLW